MIITLERKIEKGYRCERHDVFLDGAMIGEVRYNPDNWQKDKPYEAYYIQNSEGRETYDSRYATLYASKIGIYKAWKEAGEHEPKEKNSRAYRGYRPQFLPSGNADDFYPTPSKLAGEMLAMVDWRNVKTMLEPSAGKGDLIEYAQKGNYKRSRYDRELDVDCIEIDQNLQHFLVGKGYRVIHDDFLTFNTNKHYDLILMNPPFSDGDKHLMKALDLQRNGGQVVCLLNASTLRNPCTNLRHVLLQKLGEYGASIRYISNAFSQAERRTDVDVAIISVKVPASSEIKSEFFERMEKAREQQNTEWTSEPTAVTTGSIFDQLIKCFEVETEASLALFREYNAMTPYIQNGNKEYSQPLFSLKINDSEYKTVGGEGVNRYLRAVRKKYWWMLFSLPQLTSKFTSNIMSTYRDSIDKMADYDFTLFNIKNVMAELNMSLMDGIHDAIMKLFDTLSEEHSWYPECSKNRHYYNGWATNKAHKVNKKVIIPINGYYSYSWKAAELDQYRIFQTLSDLEKSLDYLDFGETADVDLSNTIQCAVRCGRTRDIYCKYFYVTFYKKGTCHITFHNQKILDVLNIYAAQNRNWIPPCYGKKSYEAMTPEEQKVVDEFQGKEAYEQVCKNSDKYLIAAGQNILKLSA